MPDREDYQRHISSLLQRLSDSSAEAVRPDEWRAEAGEVLAELHEADIADLLEQSPQEVRAALWQAVPVEQLGDVLLEVSDQLCEQLVDLTPANTMAHVLRDMSSDDVATLMRHLSKGRAAQLIRLAGLAEHAELHTSLSFDEGTVGAMMDFLPVLAREDETVTDICSRLRDMGELPSHCDKLFVVDDWERLAGVLPLKRLLINSGQTAARDIMVSEDIYSFDSDDTVEMAMGVFERYNLISAPVLNNHHKVIGRITIDELFDALHEERDLKLLNSAGVQEQEDLFAPVLHRFGNRWRWLFINLLAAFVISRVVGLFEGTIAELVALAALMPVVSGMSGNIGNQTATLTVRALALKQITQDNWKFIIRNEIFTSILNGLLWGGLVAAFAYLLYGRLDLSVVLVLAMALCFLTGAVSGFAVPIFMQRLGRDPALGATVVVTSVTDTFGFLIFLGMAALFLI